MVHYKPQSICCCLLPRAGIMTFTALFGLYYFSFVAGDVVIYPFINVILPEDFKADLMPTSFISHVCKMNNATNLISACIYFYALFLAYKRKWKSLETALYALALVSIYDIFLMYEPIKTCFTMFSMDIENIPEMAGKEDGMRYFRFTFAGITFAISILPWLIQVYMLKQTRSNVKYFLYKTDVKPSSSDAD